MTDPTPTPTPFVLTLVPVADPLAKHLGTRASRTPEQRLKLLLKAALRSWGLRCIAIRTTPDPGGATPEPSS